MPFPETQILDRFARANQDPIGSPNWSGPTRPAASSGQLKVVSNQLAASAIVGGTAHSYWSAQQFPNDQEAFLTVPVLPASGGGVSITLKNVDPSTATWDCLQWTYTVDTGWRMFEVTDVGYSLIWGPITTPLLAAGDSIGFRIDGPTCRGFYLSGKAGATWQQIAAVTNTTLAGLPGYMGVEITDLTGRVGQFGGGRFDGSLGTALVDSFIRANAATLGGQWGQTVVSGSDFRIVSNKAQGTAGAECASLWQQTVSGNCEAWVDVYDLPDGGSPAMFRLILAMNGPSGPTGIPTNPWGGAYALQYQGSDFTLNIVHLSQNGVQILDSIPWALPVGIRIGIVREDGTVRAYAWTPADGTVVLMSIDNTLWTGPGYNGLYCLCPAATTEATFQNFGGGPAPSDRRFGPRRSRRVSWT